MCRHVCTGSWVGEWVGVDACVCVHVFMWVHSCVHVCIYLLQTDLYKTNKLSYIIPVHTGTGTPKEHLTNSHQKAEPSVALTHQENK